MILASPKKKRVVFFVPFHAILAVCCFHVTAQASEATKQSPTLTEWFALGSGCRAKHDAPGDVQVQFESSTFGSTFQVSLKFSLPKYSLDGANPINKEHPTFARECALRSAIKVPAGQKIRALRTNIPFVFSKDSGAKAQLAAQLHLGNSAVASKVSEIPLQAKVEHQKENIALNASNQLLAATSSEPFPPQECGAAKIVGLDLSITNWRDSFAQKISVNLEKPKTVALDIEFESCQMPLAK